MKLSQRHGSGIACLPHENDFEMDETGHWVPKKKIVPKHVLDNGLRERIHRKVWRTTDGREIPIKDMERLHLMRTINLIKRKAHHEHPATKEYIRLMQAELHRRDPNAFSAP